MWLLVNPREVICQTDKTQRGNPYFDLSNNWSKYNLRQRQSVSTKVHYHPLSALHEPWTLDNKPVFNKDVQQIDGLLLKITFSFYFKIV